MTGNPKTILLLPLIFSLAACVEPDDVETEGSTDRITVSSLPDQNTLNEKYTRAVLGCQLDLKTKVVINGKETIESQTLNGSYDLLRDLPANKRIIFDQNQVSFHSSISLIIEQISLQNVSYPGPVDAFDAIRSPVIDARLEGSITQPAFDKNSATDHQESMKVRLLENVNTSLIELRSGLEQDPHLAARFVCRVETVLKPQFNDEYRRK